MIAETRCAVRGMERVGRMAKIARTVRWGSHKAVPDRVLGTTQPGTSTAPRYRRTVLRTILPHPTPVPPQARP